MVAIAAVPKAVDVNGRCRFHATSKNHRRMIRPTLPIISIVIYLDMIIIFGTRVECGALVVGSYYRHVVAEPHYGGTPDNGSCMTSKAKTPL